MGERDANPPIDRQVGLANPNFEAYQLLFGLENSLRIFVMRELSSEALFGKEWWEQCIPGDVKENCSSRKAAEQKRLPPGAPDVHLIFYADFADMKRIVAHKWHAFRQIVRTVPKEAILTKLEELEPLRNKVAHNRPVREEEVDLLSTYCAYFARYFPDMPGMPTGQKVSIMGKQLTDRLLGLVAELRRNRERVEKLEREYEASNWREFSDQFWLYEHRISVSYEDLDRLYWGLKEYAEIPRIIGAGDLVRNFVRESGLTSLIDSCIAKLTSDVRAIGPSTKLWMYEEQT